MIRILVVDDSEVMRRSIGVAVGAQDDLLVVGEAADGIEAIQRSQELQPDVVILDINLPGMNGIKAAPEICNVAPASRILFLTQHDSAQMVELAFRTGAYGYLVKSDAGRELAAAVRAVHEGQRFLSARFSLQRKEQTTELGKGFLGRADGIPSACGNPNMSRRSG